MKKNTDLPKVLVIAGIETSGAAGMLTDIRTLTKLNCYTAGVSTCQVHFDANDNFNHILQVGDAQTIYDGILGAYGVHGHFDAIKIGMLPNASIADAVRGALKKILPQELLFAGDITNAKDFKSFDETKATTSNKSLPKPSTAVVIDPVLICEGQDSGLDISNEHLNLYTLLKSYQPYCLTPNFSEYQVLSKIDDLADLPMLVKFGANLGENIDDNKVIIPQLDDKYLGIDMKNYCIDALQVAGKDSKYFLSTRIAITDENNSEIGVSGSGCTLSSALAGFMARGQNMATACESAHNFVWQALLNALHTKTPFASMNQL